MRLTCDFGFAAGDPGKPEEARPLGKIRVELTTDLLGHSLLACHQKRLESIFMDFSRALRSAVIEDILEGRIEQVEGHA